MALPAGRCHLWVIYPSPFSIDSRHLLTFTFREFQAKECQNHLENSIVSKLPVEILVGKKNLEVRPIDVNKGVIVKRILRENPDMDLVVCAGDDKTDEDMFRFLSAAHLAASSPPLTPLSRSRSSSITTTPTTTPTTTTATLMSPPLPHIWQHPNPTLFCITVGPDNKKTMANRRVRSSGDILRLLEQLAA